jgi:hypothetical protein
MQIQKVSGNNNYPTKKYPNFTSIYFKDYSKIKWVNISTTGDRRINYIGKKVKNSISNLGLKLKNYIIIYSKRESERCRDNAQIELILTNKHSKIFKDLKTGQEKEQFLNTYLKKLSAETDENTTFEEISTTDALSFI